MTDAQKYVVAFLGLFVFAFLIDLVAVRSGFPYGYFWYLPGFGPALFGVPPLLIVGFPILFFGASAMANRARVGHGVPYMLLVALLLFAAALVVEPVAVSKGLWAYRNGGEYIGVPVASLVGWLFTGSLAAFLFPLKLRSEKTVGLYLAIITLGMVLAITERLALPAIFALIIVAGVSWFDLRRHGWQS